MQLRPEESEEITRMEELAIGRALVVVGSGTGGSGTGGSKKDAGMRKSVEGGTNANNRAAISKI